MSDFDYPSSLGSSLGTPGSKANASMVMESVKQQIAVANAQELLSVSPSVDILCYLMISLE